MGGTAGVQRSSAALNHSLTHPTTPRPWNLRAHLPGLRGAPGQLPRQQLPQDDSKAEHVRSLGGTLPRHDLWSLQAGSR